MRWLLLFVFICRLIFASDIERGLFIINVDVPDISTFKRESVIANSLATVLVRVTGDKDIHRKLGLPDLNLQSDYFLQSLSFEPSRGNSNKIAKLVFDEEQIKKLLLKYNESFWLGKRPIGLIWAVDFGNSELLSADASFISQIKSQAAFRGIKLLVPNRSKAEFAGNFSNLELLNATWFAQQLLNYGADYNLFCMSNNLSGFSCRMAGSASFNGQALTLSQTDKAPIELVDGVADLLVKNKMTGQSSSISQLKLQINNVRGLKDYTKIVNVIKNLTGVKSCEIDQVLNSTLIVDVSYLGDEAGFGKSLNKNKKFLLEGGFVESNKLVSSLVYRWMD